MSKTPKRQHSTADNEDVPSKRARTDTSIISGSSSGPPTTSTNYPAVTGRFQDLNLSSNGHAHTSNTQSNHDSTKKRQKWEDCCAKMSDSLPTFEAIHKGKEHVQMLEDMFNLVGIVVEIFQVLETNKLECSSVLRKLEEDSTRILEYIARMKAEDAVPDPDSPLAKPIRLYTRALETIVSSLLVAHAPDEAALNRQYEMIKTTFKHSGSESLEFESIRENLAKLEVVAGQLMTFIGSYMRSETSFGHQPISDMEPVAANPNEHTIKTRPKAPTTGGDQHETCLPGTRQDILEEIEEWRSQDRPESRVFCILDMAGTGKSTIANHMAQKWDRERRLAARFFFSRGNAGTTTASDLCAAMVQELNLHHPNLRVGIKETLDRKTAINSLPISAQWEKLVMDHALRLTGGPYFLIVDALDECLEKDRQILLECILKSIDAITPFDPDLRLLLTTRAEGDITIMLDENGGTTVSRHRILRRLAGGNLSLEDVSVYIHHRLRNVSQLSISSEQREQLIKRSEGLFIFASTACSLLMQNFDRAAVIRHILSSKESSLDELYRQVLQTAIPDNDVSRKLLQQVLGVILVAVQPLSPASITHLLAHVGQAPVEEITRELGSVLGGGGENDPVYFLHPTFREFLLQRKRSGLHAISIHANHRLVATACLKELNSKLRRNICHVKKTDKLFPGFWWEHDSGELQAKLQQYTSEALRYSTKHWTIHASQGLHQPAVNSLALELFHEKLLNWMELSILLRNTGSAIQSVVRLKHDLERRIALDTGSQIEDTVVDLLNWCNDIIRFAERTMKFWENSPLELYTSALIYWQHPGPMFTHYASKRSDDRPIVRMLVERRSKRIPYVVFHGHSECILGIAFSPDGLWLASYAEDSTVRIWNASSGVQESMFSLPKVESLAYLSTGTELVAATDDGFIHRFNMKRGTPSRIPVGAQLGRCNIRVSPKDNFVLCGTTGGELVTIDLCTSAVQSRIQAHIKRVTGVDIAADGTVFASCSEDGTIHLWNGDSTFSDQQPIFTVSRPNEYWISVVLSSKNRMLAAWSHSRLRLWDIDSGTIAADASNMRHPTALAFSGDGRHLLVKEYSSFQLCDGKTGKVISQFEDAFISGENFSADGTALASLDYDTIKLWQVKDIIAAQGEEAHEHEKQSLWAFSGDYRRLSEIIRLRGNKGHQTLTIWDVAEGKKIAEPQKMVGGWKQAMSFSQNGRFLVCAGKDLIELRDGSSGGLIASMTLFSEQPWDSDQVASSPCQKMVAVRGTGGDRAKVLLLGIDERLQLTRIGTIGLSSRLYGGEVTMTFDSYGRYLRIGDMVWDVSHQLPLELPHEEATTKVQEWSSLSRSRLRWDGDSYGCPSQLEFRNPLFTYYPAPMGWSKPACHIDGDVAVIYSSVGDSMVLDFRHMPGPAQTLEVDKGEPEHFSHDDSRKLALHMLVTQTGL